MVSPKTVMNIAAGLWGHHYDAGKLIMQQEGRGLRMRIADFPSPPRAHVREENCRPILKGGDARELSLRWA
jgi:hypothetical protein